MADRVAEVVSVVVHPHAARLCLEPEGRAPLSAAIARPQPQLCRRLHDRRVVGEGGSDGRCCRRIAAVAAVADACDRRRRSSSASRSWRASGARIRRSLLPLVGAYSSPRVLTLPFVYYAASGTGSRPPSGAEAFSGDLLNLVVPTEASARRLVGPSRRKRVPGQRFGARHLPRRPAARDRLSLRLALAPLGRRPLPRRRLRPGGASARLEPGSPSTATSLAILPWAHLAATAALPEPDARQA